MVRNPILNKSVVVGIILFMVGTGVISLTAQEIEQSPLQTLNSNWFDNCRSRFGTFRIIQSRLGNDAYTHLVGCWLEEREGVKILHLNGSYYNMGYAHGFLLNKEIHGNMRILFDYFNEMGFSYSTLVESWHVLKDYIPQKFIMELQGIADGSNSSIEEIGVYNILHDIANFISCSGAIAWGSATADGNLIHMRSTDHNIFLYHPDAITGRYIQENQVLIVRDPLDEYASMSPMWAGRIGSWGGINEKGIAVSETTCWTTDTSLHGICAAFRLGMALDTADSSQKVINILNDKKTVGWNLLISDGNLPVGYILEQTANSSYICSWNNSSENTKPFWSIENVLRRTNCFISPECAALQREYYNPRNLQSLSQYLIGKDIYFGTWKHYVSLSRGLEKYWGSLDLNNSMLLLRDCYIGKYDMFFNLMQKKNAFSPMHQWVACLKTGDMLICFASKDRIASINPIHYFNLFDLLEEEPP